MPNPTLGSLMLSTTDPARLHTWYTTALPPKHDGNDENYQILDYGGFYLFIDSRDDVGERNPEPGRMLLNFDVDDAHAVAKRIDALGSTWLAPLEDRDGSWFGTVIDPDGNYVQIIELSEAHRAAVESGPSSAGTTASPATES